MKLKLSTILVLVAATGMSVACGKKKSKSDSSSTDQPPPADPSPTEETKEVKTDDMTVVALSGSVALTGLGLTEAAATYPSYWVTFEKTPKACKYDFGSGAFTFNCPGFANHQFGGFIQVAACPQPISIVMGFAGAAKKQGSLKAGPGEIKMAMTIDPENCTANAIVDESSSAFASYSGKDSIIKDLTGDWEVAYQHDDAPGFEPVADDNDPTADGPAVLDEVAAAGPMDVKHFQHDTAKNKLQIWYSADKFNQCHDEAGNLNFGLKVAADKVSIGATELASATAFRDLLVAQFAAIPDVGASIDGALVSAVDAEFTQRTADGYFDGLEAGEIAAYKSQAVAQSYVDLINEGEWFNAADLPEGKTYCENGNDMYVYTAGDPAVVTDYRPVFMQALCSFTADQVAAILASISGGAADTCMPQISLEISYETGTPDLDLYCGTESGKCVEGDVVIAPVNGLDAELDVLAGPEIDGLATAELNRIDSFPSSYFDPAGIEQPCSYASIRIVALNFLNALQTKFSATDTYKYKDTCLASSPSNEWDVSAPPPEPTPMALDDVPATDDFGGDVVNGDDAYEGEKHGDFEYSYVAEYTKK